MHTVEELVSKSGSWLSFLGFLLTVFTFLKVLINGYQLKKLNKKNFIRNRMPENLNDLKEISKKISNLNYEFEKNKRPISHEIIKITPTLKSLKKSLGNSDLEHFYNLKNQLRHHRNLYFDHDEVSWYHKIGRKYIVLDEAFVDSTYRLLTALITDIENVRMDQNKNLL